MPRQYNTWVDLKSWRLSVPEGVPITRAMTSCLAEDDGQITVSQTVATFAIGLDGNGCELRIACQTCCLCGRAAVLRPA